MEKLLFERIKELRKKNKLSQKDLAKKLNISNRAVSKWENGLSEPTISNLVHMSKIFGVSVDYFFNVKKMENKKKNPTGMESVKAIYKIGRGPSSSHTIGPERASIYFKNKNSSADSFKVILFGSLAKTGKGHGTDVVIKKTLSPKKCEIVFDFTNENIPHPNTMDIFAYKDNKEVDKARILSVGGGNISILNEKEVVPENIYSHTSFAEILKYCKDNSLRLYEYVMQYEKDDYIDYMKLVWQTMKNSIKRGLSDEGILPGGLDVLKKAKTLYNNQYIGETAETRENRIVCSYAFAVGEQNASGETIVTAPTCGAAGVLPSVLYYEQIKNKFSDDEIINALSTAGIIGNLIKTNASISGAECGCQAEVGSACAMASAALGELFNLNLEQIEYAAEIAIEHHLGLTCDPICGLVQIPCIERNAVAAMRAINAVNLASFLWNSRKISFDKVVETMRETGLDMHKSYKETSEAGLAKIDI